MAEHFDTEKLNMTVSMLQEVARAVGNCEMISLADFGTILFELQVLELIEKITLDDTIDILVNFDPHD